MFLFWGSEHTCFYNDAYRPSLGKDGKHPHILGMAGEKAWPEIWAIIYPLIRQVLDTGEATWSEDQLIPIYRNNQLEDVYWTFSYSPVNDESGKAAGVFVTCSETTEKVVGLKHIEESEKNFRSLIMEAPFPAGVFMGKDLRIKLANTAALQLWGKTTAVIGKTLVEAIPELQDQAYMQILQEVYDTGVAYEGLENLAWLEVDGKLTARYVNFIYKALRDTNGNVNGILTMGYDVTEQVLARNKILEAEERTRLSLDAARLGSFDMNLLTDELNYTPRMEEIFGLEPGAHSAADFTGVIHPDDQSIRIASLEKAMAEGFANYEVRVTWPDASIHWVKVFVKVFYDEAGKPIRYSGIASDTTELKRHIEKVRETEQRFRDTVKQAPVGITILRGRDFIPEMANETYLQLVDRKEGDFIGRPLFDSLPEVKEVVEPLLNGVLDSGEPFYESELPVTLNRYGKTEIGYFNLVYHPLRDAGKTSGIMVVATEVTQQVVATHKLAQSELQFRNMVMQSPIPMTIFRGPDHIIEIANVEMYRNIWRREERDVMGKKVLDVFPELRDQKYPQLLKAVLEKGVAHRENEAVAFVQGDDGMKKFYLDYEYAPLYDPDGKVSGVMITVNDVTEKVEARTRIEESEERLSMAIRTTQLGTWEYYPLTGKLVWSEECRKIYGMPAGVQPDYELFTEHIYPADRAYALEHIGAAMDPKGQGGYDITYRITRFDDDSVRWIQARGKVFFNEQREAERFIGTVLDISNEKEAQKALADSEERLRLAAEGTRLATWDLNLLTREIIYTPRLAQIFGHDESAQLTQAAMRSQVLPEDEAEIVQPAFAKAMQTGIYFYEARITRKDGSAGWIKTQGRVVYDEQGEPVRLIGTTVDITEDKINEENIVKLASIVRSSDDAIITKTLDGIITSWNEAAQRIFGYEPGEIIGQHIFTLIPQEKQDEELVIIGKLRRGERLDHFETQRVTKSGSLIDISLSVSPLRDSRGRLIGASKIVRNITDQKNAERLIAENEQRLQIAVEAAEMGTWELDLQTGDVLYSDRYIEILGQEKGVGAGLPDIMKHIHPADLDLYNSTMKEALKTGRLDLQVRVTPPGNRALRWIRSKGKVFYDQSNRPLKMMGTTVDVSDQVQMEEVLRESEQRFKIIANTVPVMIWMSGNDKYSDFFNTSWLDFTGRKLKDETQDGWLDGVHPEDVPLCIATYKRSFEKQESFYIEYRLKRKDGEYRLIADNAVPRYDADGVFAGFISACTDITEEKQFSNELRISEERFRLLADSMAQLIWTGDAGGNLNYFNKAVYEFSGLNFDTIQGEGWLNIVHPEDRPENVTRWIHSVNTGEDFIYEHRFRRHDGTYRWQLSRARPYKDNEGRIKMWVGTSTDINDIKESEQQKDFFISMASHELKTPITSIKGYVQILQSMYATSEDAFLKKSLDTVNRQIVTLTSLISDLLDMSKIKSGSLQLSSEVFDLNEMIRDTIQEVSHTEPGFKIEFSQGDDTHVRADKGRIGQVLINFLTNAIKYSPNAPLIKVKSEVKDGNVIVSVADSGIGISKSEQDKIFQRFYRVEGKDEKTFPGFGIGLFIASEIIQRHKGKISVESEPGKGSTFYFSIPLIKN